MKIGKGTEPWGNWRVAARALVTLMAIQYLPLSLCLRGLRAATYRAPGDWLVRQGRVHLANYSCYGLFDGRDGDRMQVEHLPCFVWQKKMALSL
jgi:hypothetical protein